MKEKFNVRTDLALEAKEDVDASHSKLEGVIVEEKVNRHANIHVIKLTITNTRGERLLKKPAGTYLTLEAPQMAEPSEEYHREISCVLAEYIRELIQPYWRDDGISVLVVGLGNREVTPDALGPNVVNNIAIRRESEVDGQKISISGIVPGVMAQTGMETASIIKGVVAETKPDVVIAIDALAARNSKRLNTTIQVSDTGIHPGSGVGNHRLAITRETIGTNVIAIGVPTVIDTPTIVYDTLENLLKALSVSQHFRTVSETFRQFNDNEKYQLIREIIAPEMSDMFVTPKDADETIKRIGYTISEAINIATNS
ncbi:MAG: GPR endopeptidase [Alistipes sp.]|nr:GPR endopeptidase [Alistipes sp.]